MWTVTAVFTCALELLGRPQASAPRVELIERVPPGISALATGYVLLTEKRIVLITSTPAFVQARHASERCGDVEAIREIAGVFVHEEWHLTHGVDEAGAYDAQMIALLQTGANADSRLFHKIKQTKLAVLAGAKRKASTGVTAGMQATDERSQGTP